jgi:hypothetical protein
VNNYSILEEEKVGWHCFISSTQISSFFTEINTNHLSHMLHIHKKYLHKSTEKPVNNKTNKIMFHNKTHLIIHSCLGDIIMASAEKISILCLEVHH